MVITCQVPSCFVTFHNFHPFTATGTVPGLAVGQDGHTFVAQQAAIPHLGQPLRRSKLDLPIKHGGFA